MLQGSIGYHSPGPLFFTLSLKLKHPLTLPFLLPPSFWSFFFLIFITFVFVVHITFGESKMNVTLFLVMKLDVSVL